MGFFKLFFRRNRKSKRAAIPEILISEPYVPVPQQSQQEVNAEIARLLRTSSAHLRVPDMGKGPLPPLPHSTDSISSHSSTITRTPSLKNKTSFVSKVYERVLHSKTEFPNANPPLSPPQSDTTNESNTRRTPKPRRRRPKRTAMTPHDQSRLMRLRQDPSVLSLVNMYDSHGCLDDNAFTNTPRRRPSQRVKQDHDIKPHEIRRESTLRDLLRGSSETDNSPHSDDEENIAWADRFLNAASESSTSLQTTSSLGLETPTSPLFKPDVSIFKRADDGNLSGDLSLDSTAAYPHFSSMEVEVSGFVDPNDVTLSQPIQEGRAQFTRSPSQRASQVFRFLSVKREKRHTDDNEARPLPHIPTGGPSKQSSDANTMWIDDFEDSHLDLIPMLDIFPSAPLTDQELEALALPAPKSMVTRNVAQPKLGREKSLSVGVTDVLRPNMKLQTRIPSMSTAPQQSFHRPFKTSDLHAPKGPRAKVFADFDDILDMKNVKSELPAFAKASDKTKTTAGIANERREKKSSELSVVNQDRDHYTPVPPRPSHRRTSSKLTHVETKKQGNAYPTSDKENALPDRNLDYQGIAKPWEADAEHTPVKARANAIPFHVRVQAPSPASSSELSPAAKQMMTDLRAQKPRVREALARRSKRIRAGI